MGHGTSSGRSAAPSQERQSEMIRDYTRAYQNQLSSSAERRMRELQDEASRSGLEFHMTNETAYMQPNALVTPNFELRRVSGATGVPKPTRRRGR